MLVIQWERAWGEMVRLEATEAIRLYNISALASGWADPMDVHRIVSDWQQQAEPRSHRVGNLRRFGSWLGALFGRAADIFGQPGELKAPDRG